MSMRADSAHRGGGRGWPSGKASRFIMLAFSGFVLVGFLALLSSAIWEKRGQTLHEAEHGMSNLARTLEEHAVRQVQEIDFALATLSLVAEEQLAHGQPDRRKLRQELLARIPPETHDYELSIVGAAGELIADSRDDVTPSDFSDHPEFTVQRDNPAAGLFIARPRRDADGVWTLSFSRRIDREDGGFGGIVRASVDVARIEAFYASLDVGRFGTVTLWTDTASRVIARNPHNPSLYGQVFDRGPLFEKIRDGTAIGTFISPSPLDGIERIVSFRRVANLPLVVSVALATEEVLAPWRRDLWRYVAGAAVGTVLLAAVTAFLWHQFTRQERLVAALSESEAALRQSEERFRDYAETASDWYWETDTEHRFTYVSNRIRVFGIDPESLIGRRRIDGALDPDAPKWQEHMACLERREPFSNFVYSYISRGEERYSAPSGKPLFAPEGHFLGYRGSGRDVTDEIRTEQRLQEAKTVAEAASRAKSEFLASMSHELRTPLNAIIGFSDLIRNGICSGDEKRLRDYANDIYASGEHLLKLISDILEVSRIEAGKLELREETVDLAATAAACLRLVRQRAAEAEVAVRVAELGSLPSVRVDPTRLKQILLNLLSNAIKFTPAGGSVMVDAELDEDGAMVIRVADTGIGMSAEECALAMEPFRQIDSRLARRYEGTGLGLPLTKAFIEMHGGRLALDSKSGSGTTVFIILPADRVQQRVPAMAMG